jgi:hypothetical protein
MGPPNPCQISINYLLIKQSIHAILYIGIIIFLKERKRTRKKNVTDFARYTPKDFLRFVRWDNNNGKAGESSTREWVEKATTKLDLSLSNDSKLSMTAKWHSVFNFWKLDF